MKNNILSILILSLFINSCFFLESKPNIIKSGIKPEIKNSILPNSNTQTTSNNILKKEENNVSNLVTSEKTSENIINNKKDIDKKEEAEISNTKQIEQNNSQYSTTTIQKNSETVIEKDPKYLSGVIKEDIVIKSSSIPANNNDILHKNTSGIIINGKVKE
jgi:hypothetical protein